MGAHNFPPVPPRCALLPPRPTALRWNVKIQEKEAGPAAAAAPPLLGPLPLRLLWALTILHSRPPLVLAKLQEKEAAVPPQLDPPAPGSASAPGGDQGAPGGGDAAIDPAIAAWWRAQHADAVASGRVPAAPAAFDVTVAPPASIQAAVDRCREGGSILLQPGAYEGGVVLSKEVHLYGRGEATLRFAAGTAPVITSTAAAATVDGLVVRFDSKLGAGTSPGISVKGGSLLIRHCDVADLCKDNVGNFAPGIRVDGGTSRPTILGCRVSDCTTGVAFWPASGGVVESCDILGCNPYGVSVSGAAPSILSNKIRGGAGAGVHLSGSATKARLEGNYISEMGASGIEVVEGSDPSLLANFVFSNKGAGVFVHEAKGVLSGNTIYLNDMAGVWVKALGDPTLVGNIIRDHTGTFGFGVIIEVKARGNVVWGEGNVFSGNRVAALGCFGKDPDAAPAQAVGQPQAATVQAASPADAKLLRELECIVCKDIMLRPYMVCHEGHASACMPCFKKLKDCPVCRRKLLSPPARILPLESMAQDLLLPCPHFADGCTLNALRYADAGAHAGICDWRKVRHRIRNKFKGNLHV